MGVCRIGESSSPVIRKRPAVSVLGLQWWLRSDVALVPDAAQIGQRTICQPGARATVILAALSKNSIDSRRRRGTLMGVLVPDLTHDGHVHHATVGNIGGGGSFDLAAGGVRAGLLVW